ncbi:hypothetical protein M011DRAFT_486013 [Sporormia fimetaria CBS 119925]|uniref:Extracellular membrane protein CFEM domain-containing protein n=1 Tax=Sporormia fimetaria CBS 119925 TaxID=1340428 RepID=A0A6A6VE92_9PLEO|nr:hypothetical protein M011DRAFT_486013 [Sporormia fimetaria CBS 119925]
MKYLALLSTLLTIALASPIAVPEEAGEKLPVFPPVLPMKCRCEPPICPMELIAECKCKNAAAESCYVSMTAKGIKCPKPVPQVCGVYTDIE